MGTKNPNEFEKEAREAIDTNNVTQLMDLVRRAEALVDTFGRFIDMQVPKQDIDMQVRKQDIFNALDPRHLGHLRGKKNSRENESSL